MAHSASTRQIERAASARKRQEIGLSPQRDTAQSMLYRPPDHAASPRNQRAGCWMALLLCFVMLGAGFLLGARFRDYATAWPVVVETVETTLNRWWTQLGAGTSDVQSTREEQRAPDEQGASAADSSQGIAQTVNTRLSSANDWLAERWAALRGTPDSALDVRYTRLANDDFDAASILPAATESGQWSMSALSSQGVYRMRVRPPFLAWTVFSTPTGPNAPSPIRAVEMNATISADTPNGVVGFMARHQPDGSFYLFTLDGRGRAAVSMLSDNQWRVIQPPLPIESSRAAGGANTIALEDMSELIRFSVNNTPIIEFKTPTLPDGAFGLVGSAGESPSGVEINVDWLRLYGVRP